MGDEDHRFILVVAFVAISRRWTWRRCVAFRARFVCKFSSRVAVQESRKRVFLSRKHPFG
jgi:hypothetical protein